jgi:pimeloyl-ACP methyl ester carboxylesterase
VSKKVLVGIAIILAVLVLSGAAFYVVRNPEHSTLDAEARRGAPGKFVTLADGVTHYDVAGPDSGKLVVLIHGFSVPYYIWDSTTTALADSGYRVVRYDLYGRGYSDRPATEYTADLFDRQLVQLLDSVGARDPVHLIGLSMGGWVSASFVGRHPERVRSLTLIDPVAERGTVPGIVETPLIGGALFQMMAVPGMADGQTSDLMDSTRFPGWADKYRPQMRYKGFGRALLSTIRERAKVDIDSVYRQVAATGVPVMLLWGRGDVTVPYALNEKVRKDIPNAEFHTIEGAAHLPHMERAQVVNPFLYGFLAGRSRFPPNASRSLD